MINPIKWYASTSCLLPGYTFLVLGKYEKATLFFDMAIRFGPSIPEAYLRRGDCYYGKEDYLRAIQDYDTAIEMRPIEPLVYRARARAWSCLGEWENSISDYDHAVSLNENDAASHFERGSAYMSISDFARALKDFEKASGIDSRHQEYLAAIGHAHWCLGSPNKAAEAYSKCRGNAQGNSFFYLLLRSLALREAGMDNEALDCLAEVSKSLNPKDWAHPIVSYLLGVVPTDLFLESMNKQDQPIKDTARFFVGINLKLSGDKEGAIEQFRWLEKHGDKRIVVNALAIAQLQRLTAN